MDTALPCPFDTRVRHWKIAVSAKLGAVLCNYESSPLELMHMMGNTEVQYRLLLSIHNCVSDARRAAYSSTLPPYVTNHTAQAILRTYTRSFSHQTYLASPLLPPSIPSANSMLSPMTGTITPSHETYRVGCQLPQVAHASRRLPPCLSS